jgi:hypothetical protein
MLFAISLVAFGWLMASLYIYLERKYPHHAEKTYFLYIFLFSAGAIFILIALFAFGVGLLKTSDLWG